MLTKERADGRGSWTHPLERVQNLGVLGGLTADVAGQAQDLQGRPRNVVKVRVGVQSELLEREALREAQIPGSRSTERHDADRRRRQVERAEVGVGAVEYLEHLERFEGREDVHERRGHIVSAPDRQGLERGERLEEGGREEGTGHVLGVDQDALDEALELLAHEHAAEELVEGEGRVLVARLGDVQVLEPDVRRCRPDALVDDDAFERDGEALALVRPLEVVHGLEDVDEELVGEVEERGGLRRRLCRARVGQPSQLRSRRTGCESERTCRALQRA